MMETTPNSNTMETTINTHMMETTNSYVMEKDKCVLHGSDNKTPNNALHHQNHVTYVCLSSLLGTGVFTTVL